VRLSGVSATGEVDGSEQAGGQEGYGCGRGGRSGGGESQGACFDETGYQRWAIRLVARMAAARTGCMRMISP
jgi:hypothetical protein